MTDKPSILLRLFRFLGAAPEEPLTLNLPPSVLEPKPSADPLQRTPKVEVTVKPSVTIRFEYSCRTPPPRPSQERDPRIKPTIDISSPVIWRSPETGLFWTRIAGTEHYEAACKPLFHSPDDLDFRPVFDAMIVPEENPYDENAVAVYRVGNGQVGHISRMASSDWRPLVDELYQLAGVIPVCRAEAKRVRAYYDYDIQIRLEITLPILRAELKSRRPKKPRAKRVHSKEK